MRTRLNEAYSMVKQLCDIPSIEDELKQLGYTDQEIPELVKLIVPEATAALEKMGDLWKRWDSLKSK